MTICDFGDSSSVMASLEEGTTSQLESVPVLPRSIQVSIWVNRIKFTELYYRLGLKTLDTRWIIERKVYSFIKRIYL